MTPIGNMGPFESVSIKGKALANGVPTLIHQLPLTKGGIAGNDLYFGRVVHSTPATNRREFKLGVPDGSIIQGIVIFNPSIARADPGMNNYYFAGRPCTIATMGLVDILDYDTSQDAPVEGSTVWANKVTGKLAFNDGTDISGTGDGYVKLNAYVYEALDPNGAKVFFSFPLVSTMTRITVTQAAAPTATPAAGQVALGTTVTLATTTPGARIFYTLDDTAPDMASMEYTGTPITIQGATKIRAIAIKDGMDPSTELDADYTIQ